MIFTKFRKGTLGDIFGEELGFIELYIEDTDMSIEEMRVMESCALNQDPFVEASENKQVETQSDEDFEMYEYDDEDDNGGDDDESNYGSYEEDDEES